MGTQFGFLREGWGYDCATGKQVDMRKPEEAVRQKYEQILHEDYSYDYKQMDIEVYIKRGSRNEKGKNGERQNFVYSKHRFSPLITIPAFVLLQSYR